MSRSKRNAAADDYFKNAPGYCSEAIPHLIAQGNSALRHGKTRAARSTLDLVERMEQGTKFALPRHGRLFDNVSRSMIGGWRLPYETVVFEYDAPLNPDEPRDKWHAISVPKRIVVAWEHEDGAFVWPVNYWDAKKIWVANWCGYWLRYLNEAIELSEEEQERIRCSMGDLTDGSGHPRADGPQSDFGFFGRPALFGDFVPNGSRQEIEIAAYHDCHDEIVATLQACAALACTNVTTDVIRPNREARAARPASTLFDYHVLMIRAGAGHQTSEDKGGTHASPRTHLRRGHIRRLAWGPRVWVNSCVVNPSAIGTVNKDYRVVD